MTLERRERGPTYPEQLHREGLIPEATSEAAADFLGDLAVTIIRGDVDAARDTLEKISDALDLEASARATADQDEADARQAADDSEAATRLAADQAEAVARQAADDLLAPKDAPTFTNGITLSSGPLRLASLGSLAAAADGVLTLLNNAGTSFARLQFGGVTAAFPSIMRSGAGLTVRAADNSADAAFTAGSISGSSFTAPQGGFMVFTSRVMLTGTGDGVLKLSNASQSDFNRLLFGGATAAFPALKRNGVALEARRADDSAYTDFGAAHFSLTEGVAAPAASAGRTLLFVDATDGLAKLRYAGGQTEVIASRAYVDTQVAGLVDSSPATLDTLNELAAALGDDPNYAASTATALGYRVRVDAAQAFSEPEKTQARANLDVPSLAAMNTALGLKADATQTALITALGYTPTFVAANLAVAGAMPLPAAETSVRVLAYDGASQVCPAVYVEVAADPGHALKFQNGGRWFAIAEAWIDVRMAGAVNCTFVRDAATGELTPTGTDSAAAILRAHKAGNALLRGDFIMGRVIADRPFAVIRCDPTGHLFPAAGMAALAMFDLRADWLTLISPRIYATPCVGAASTSNLSAGIRVPRQGTTMPSQNWHRAHITVIDPYVFGGLDGVNVRGVSDFVLDGGLFEWQFNQGVICSGDLKDVTLAFEARYTACLGNDGSGGFRIGTDTSSTCRSVTVKARTKWCGWLAGTLTGMVSTAPQSGFDFFLHSAENLFLDLVSENCGDTLEVKKASDPTAHNNYRNLNIKLTAISNMCRGVTHVKLRDDSSELVSVSDKEQTVGVDFAGSTVTSDPFSQAIVLGTDKISTVAGSRTATIDTEAVSHWGEVGEIFKLFGCGPIGGVSATEFCKENVITAKTANTISFELPYAAQATASGGTAAELYGLFRSPLAATIDLVDGSDDATINLINHGLVQNDILDLSAFATTAGIDASFVNRSYFVHSVPNADQLVIRIASAATSTVAGVALKVQPRRCAGECGVWLTTWKDATIEGVIFNRLARVFLLEGAVGGGGDEPLVNPSLVGNVFKNCGNLVDFGDGYIDGLEFIGNSGSHFGRGLTPMSNCKAVRRARTGGNDIVTRAGQEQVAFIQGQGFQDCDFGDDVHVCDRGYYLHDKAGTGSNEASARNRYRPRSSRVVNPDNPSVVSTRAAENCRIDGVGVGAGAALQIAFCNMEPASDAFPTITRNGAAGIGDAGISGRIERGFTTNDEVTALAIPGAIGEWKTATAPTATYRGQECITAGAAGVAVWTPRA